MVLDERTLVAEPAVYVPPVVKKSFFDDTHKFWEEEATRETADEELLGPSIMSDDALTATSLLSVQDRSLPQEATGSTISLVSGSNKNKKKTKKPSFRSSRKSGPSSSSLGKKMAK